MEMSWVLNPVGTGFGLSEVLWKCLRDARVDRARMMELVLLMRLDTIVFVPMESLEVTVKVN